MSVRLNGSKLILTIDGVDHMADVAEWEFPAEEEKDAGTKTFGDVANGTVGEATLTVTIVQSTDATSLLMRVWREPGKRNVPYVLAPHGNSSPSEDQPHFRGELRFPTLRPALGIAAGDEDKTVEIEFPLHNREIVTE